MSSKRILITGGAGFIGSHLCDSLIAEGNEVICLDNFYTGHRQNIEHLLDHPRFELIRHDVIEPLSLHVDEIYNLACAASPVHYQKLPIETTRTSIVGALNMLELARTRKATIFQASTSEVYGDPHQHPQKESYWGNVNPIGIRSCYDEGKRCAETLFFDYYRQSEVRIKVGRIFNTYGPRMLQHDGRAVSNFIVQALRGNDITIYGDGSQTRSFCYYSDLVEAILRLMRTGNEVTGPINLGNPQEITIRQLAESIVSLTGSKSKIVLKPLPKDDPTRRLPDISQARAILGWQPTVSLEEGLRSCITYFESVLSNAPLRLAVSANS